MNVFRVIVARVVGMFGKGRLEQKLEHELQFHFEQEVELHVSRGLSIEDAQAEARKRFGGVDRAKELYRDTCGFPTIENFFRDLRYALRMLRNNPGFAMVAILSLALGIGINAAVFTIVNAALLRSLPVASPDRLARISPSINGRPQEFSYLVLREIAERQQSFSDVAASGGLSLRHVIFEGRELQQMEHLSGSYVSTNYFRMLGIQAHLGRLFSSTDAQRPDESAVVVLRHGFWESAFGKDQSVIGRILMINGVPLTIIGIAPRDFTGDQVGRVQDLWVPLELQPRLDSRNLLEARTAAFFGTLGRLKAGMLKSQAVADVTAIYQQILAGENDAGTGTRLNRPNPASARVEVLVGMDGFNPTRQRNWKPLMILMTVVAVVLLIACLNVANLLLARKRGARARDQHTSRARVESGAHYATAFDRKPFRCPTGRSCRSCFGSDRDSDLHHRHR
jgi:MacB-like periplasmic core domain